MPVQENRLSHVKLDLTPPADATLSILILNVDSTECRMTKNYLIIHVRMRPLAICSVVHKIVF